MQIPTLVRRYTLIFLRYLFARDVFHILWLWHSGVFDYKYWWSVRISCSDAWSRLGAILQSRDRSMLQISVTWLQYRTVDCWHVQHWIMMNVTKWLAVGHTTTAALKHTDKTHRLINSPSTAADNVQAIKHWNQWLKWQMSDNVKLLRHLCWMAYEISCT